MNAVADHDNPILLYIIRDRYIVGAFCSVCNLREERRFGSTLSLIEHGEECLDCLIASGCAHVARCRGLKPVEVTSAPTTIED
jgi:hypothetical protein